MANGVFHNPSPKTPKPDMPKFNDGHVSSPQGPRPNGIPGSKCEDHYMDKDIFDFFCLVVKQKKQDPDEVLESLMKDYIKLNL